MVFGTPTTCTPVLVQLGRDAERVLAPDGHQGVDTEVAQVLLDAVDATLDLDGVGARRPEDGAAAREDAPHHLDVECEAVALERTLPAVAESDELVAVLADTLADDRPDHGVQARAVAAAGQHSHTHCLLSLSPACRCRRHQHGPRTVPDQRRRRRPGRRYARGARSSPSARSSSHSSVEPKSSSASLARSVWRCSSCSTT